MVTRIQLQVTAKCKHLTVQTNTITNMVDGIYTVTANARLSLHCLFPNILGLKVIQPSLT